MRIVVKAISSSPVKLSEIEKLKREISILKKYGELEFLINIEHIYEYDEKVVKMDDLYSDLEVDLGNNDDELLKSFQ